MKQIFPYSNNIKGFTFIELIIVMSILVTLVSFSSVFYSRFLLQNAVANTADQFVTSLRKAQIYSMQGKQNSAWSVNYSSNTITLYKGNTFSSRDSSFDEKFSINPNISISGFIDLNFAKITGKPTTGNPSTTPTITISAGNTSRTITVNAEGIIDRGGGGPPPPGSPPTVNTLAATSVTDNAATLNGSANPNSSTTTGYFRYSTTDPGSCNDTFGTRVPLSGGTDLGAGTSAVAYLENLTSLSASTTYYFCAIASNATGTSFGSILNFTTNAPPADIQFIGQTGAAGNNTTAGSFSLPSGWAAGDVAVFRWYTFTNTKTITPPGTITQKQQASAAGFGRIYIGYRVLQSGDSTFAWTASSANNSTVVWGTSVFRGVNTTGDPFEAQSGAPATFANTSRPNPPAVTTVSANAMVLTIFGKNNDYTSITPPASYTTAGSNSATAGNDASAGGAYLLKVTQGVEDPGAWTAAGASTDDGYLWTGALRP